MISPKKLESLGRVQGLRKIRLILLELRHRCILQDLDQIAIHEFWGLLRKGVELTQDHHPQLAASLTRIIDQLPLLLDSGSRISGFRGLATKSHQGLLAFEQELRLPVGEWDLDLPTGGIQASSRKTDPASGGGGGESYDSSPELQVYLDGVRSPFNVGSIFRTCDAFGVARVLLGPSCPRPGSARVDRSSMGAAAWIPWQILSQEEVPEYCMECQLEPIVLETGGVDYLKAELPPRCLMILGSEELGVSPEFLEDRKIVSIPMFGRKVSINVGVSFGILAAYWRSRF